METHPLDLPMAGPPPTQVQSLEGNLSLNDVRNVSGVVSGSVNNSNVIGESSQDHGYNA